jgi:hypothetical protein
MEYSLHSGLKGSKKGFITSKADEDWWRNTRAKLLPAHAKSFFSQSPAREARMHWSSHAN